MKRLIPWTVVLIFIAIFLIVNHQSRMDPSGSKSQSRQTAMPDVVTAGVTLQWDPVDADGCELHWGIAPAYTQIVDTSVETVTVGGLNPGTTYNFKVRAYNRQCWTAPPPNCDSFYSAFSSELVYTVPAGATPPPTPPPTPLPTAPPTPTPIPQTPTPMPTAAPTPTPLVSPTATPGIILNPVTLNFTGVVGGPWPTPMSIQVTTSNGAAWTSLDTSNWFDTGQWNHGPSGASCVLTPHTQGMVAGTYPDPIKFSAPGLPPRTITVTLTLTPKPTPTPVRTPSPSPTSTPVPPTPTCTPCPCGNHP